MLKTHLLDPNKMVKLNETEIQFAEKLDKGKFSEVYLGTWQNKKIAIKRSGNSIISKEEALLHSNISHPHIVAIHGYFESTTTLNIVMELMDNQDMWYYMLQTPRNTTEELHHFYQIFLKVLSGLIYLHDQVHIIHRDLKPENILLDKNLTPKICDFNCSSVIGPNTEILYETYAGGSVYWSAIESMLPDGRHFKISRKTDIYSMGLIFLGILLNNTMTLYPEKAKDHEILNEKLNGNIPTIPASISSQTKFLITWSLKHNQVERPTAVQFKGMLEQIIEDEVKAQSSQSLN